MAESHSYLADVMRQWSNETMTAPVNTQENAAANIIADTINHLAAFKAEQARSAALPHNMLKARHKVSTNVLNVEYDKGKVVNDKT